VDQAVRLGSLGRRWDVGGQFGGVVLLGRRYNSTLVGGGYKASYVHCVKVIKWLLLILFSSSSSLSLTPEH
jgi:hypothetical protein